MTFYRRRLPHWHPEGRWLFVTWRLYGSLPPKLLRSSREATHRGKPGYRFKAWDTLLDKAQVGPVWLREERIAKLIVDELLRGEEELLLYKLYAFVVMPNHVHVLIDPKVPLREITNRIKGVTSRQANRVLQRTGQPFWQDESFDHWLRSNDGFDRTVRYVERNPVTAGLTAKPEDWLWSSASMRKTKLGVAQPLGCA